jgi:hypothetical protein
MTTPERLAYWYLRLNGFLLLEDYVIHPDRGAEQRTDADLLGIRLRHRLELLEEPMEDDRLVADCQTLCNVIIGEVKRGRCGLNGPWTNHEDLNINRVLRAIGCFAPRATSAAADELYRCGRYVRGSITCRLLAFGNEKGKLAIPAVPQILFRDMIQFIHRRFRKYKRQKSSVGMWAPDGQQLRVLAERYPELSEFDVFVRQYFGIPSPVAVR